MHLQLQRNTLLSDRIENQSIRIVSVKLKTSLFITRTRWWLKDWENMYPQGGFRNSSSTYSAGDRSQPSRMRSVPPSEPQPQMPKPAPKLEAKQEGKTPDAGQDQSSTSRVGDTAQPVKRPSSAVPQPQPQAPKQEVKQEQKVAKAEKEESHATPASRETQVISSASQNENKGRRIILLKDGIADEEAAKIKVARSEKSLQKEIKDDISNLTCRLAELHGQRQIALGDQKQPGEEVAVRVITMAGENRGATMDLGSDMRKQDTVEIHRGYKLNDDDKGEDGLSAKEKSRGNPPSKGVPANAFVNSNVQGANNSILYNSSSSHRDPGVYLAISNNPVSAFRQIERGPAFPDGEDLSKNAKTAGPGSKSTNRLKEMNKADQTVPPPKDPGVKRRCLRALFLESSSDSDPESKPQKPVRHGCRYQCQDSTAKSNSKDAPSQTVVLSRGDAGQGVINQLGQAKEAKMVAAANVNKGRNMILPK